MGYVRTYVCAYVRTYVRTTFFTMGSRILNFQHFQNLAANFEISKFLKFVYKFWKNPKFSKLFRKMLVFKACQTRVPNFGIFVQILDVSKFSKKMEFQKKIESKISKKKNEIPK